jgi:uncharacterized membrane protein affecting hemolysin expression
VSRGPAGLVSVAVPAGDHQLVLQYRAPGLRLGMLATAGAVVVALVQAVAWWVLVRRRRRNPQRSASAIGAAPGTT